MEAKILRLPWQWGHVWKSILKTRLSKPAQDSCCLGIVADSSCSAPLPKSLSGGRGTTSGRSLALRPKGIKGPTHQSSE